MRAQLRKRRLELGLRQIDVSAALNKRPEYISWLENHTKSIPNLTTIYQWAAALGGGLTITFEPDEEEP